MATKLSLLFYFPFRFAEALSGHYDYIDEKVDDLEEDLLCLSDFRIHMTAKEAGMDDFALDDGSNFYNCHLAFFFLINLLIIIIILKKIDIVLKESNKMQKLKEILADLHKEGHRVLLFSQMTKYFPSLSNFTNFPMF